MLVVQVDEARRPGRRLRRPLLDLAASRYVVAEPSADDTARYGDPPLVALADAPEGTLRIYENPAALPRALFATDWRWADFETLMKDGEWPIFDPTHTVLLDQFPGQRPIARLSAGHPLLNSVSLTMYTNTEVVVDVDAPFDQILVLNDVWHPWWRASVDGVPTEILKANVIFRAVLVPRGHHTVRFTFHPFSGAFAELFGKVRHAP